MQKYAQKFNPLTCMQNYANSSKTNYSVQKCAKYANEKNMQFCATVCKKCGFSKIISNVILEFT